MEKVSIKQTQLIDAINLALKKDWPYEGKACQVIALKKADIHGSNWDVITEESSDENKCKEILERILDELREKYYISWITDIK